MLTTKRKENIIKKFQTTKTDTGSPEVQIAILTEEIKSLAKHLKKHHKDNHSRRGLLQMVANRRSIMGYLSKKNEKRYGTLVKKLELKKSK